MPEETALQTITLVFAGAAALGGLALYARQSLLVAYIVLGALLGPWGAGLVTHTETIRSIGEIGIIFLLFLLGLNLHPQKLARMLSKAVRVTLVSSLAFAAIGAAVALAFGFGPLESMLIGIMATFSSTILGLKLLPTTALHHRHTGGVIISVLLLQDVIAVLMLAVLGGVAGPEPALATALVSLAALPAVAAAAFVGERYVLEPLIRRFDTIHEYVFLTAVGWCVGFAALGALGGLSYELGAFIGGVALAQSRVSTYIAESLKPLRDFFLIMFFFSLGASFELPALPAVALPAAVLAAALLVAKPLVFRALLTGAGEPAPVSLEIGVRLGQMSEFALLISVLALEGGFLGERAAYFAQAATLLTFIASSYVIMLRFPTPIAVDERLRRD